MPEQRHLKVHAPALQGDQELFAARIEGYEALSEPFAYHVTLQARSDAVSFDDVLGQEMCIGIELPSGGERYIHGYVASFGLAGTEGDHFVYLAELRPHLWRLTRATDCRIFQGEAVPEIVKAILKQHLIADVEENHGASNRGPFLPWEYCVQYRESDFAFVSRLLELEGIHYYFKHEKSRHVLVLADSNMTHMPVPGYEKIENRRAYDPRQRQYERIWGWSMTRSVLPGRTVATDYDFKQPSLQLRSQSGSEVERTHRKVLAEDYETYDHLETVVQQSGYAPALVEQYARMRTEELHARFEVVKARTDARGLCTGATFALENGPAPSQGRTYLVLRTELTAGTDPRASTEVGGEDVAYVCRFDAIDTRHPYRPPRLTPKPVIAGLQSATVVGGPGSKYWTNEHGQVRVKFHWDRTDKKDQSCSCWVRVSQSTAGPNWGSLYLPHVGHEVLISFLEGDPDRPIVVGNVYNGNNKPPVTIPPNGYKSLTRDVAGNQIVFDATPGEESLMCMSPNQYSGARFGKEGIKLFTRSKIATYSYDSESFHFGSKKSFTKGETLSIDRGQSISVKSGFSFSYTGGLDIKTFLGVSADLKVGAGISAALSNTFSYTRGREYKLVRGTYRRTTKGDALLDSLKTAYVCGGEKDKTMMTSNDDELVLSYDDGSRGRKGMFDVADAWAKGIAVAGAATMGTVGYAGSTWYKEDVSERAPERDKDAKTVEMDMELDRVAGVSESDRGTVLAAVVGLGASIGASLGKDTNNPAHKSPSARVVLRNELVKIFAGTKEDTEILVSKSGGLMMHSERSVVLESEKADIKIAAQKEVAIKSSAAISLNGMVKHRNIVIMK